MRKFRAETYRLGLKATGGTAERAFHFGAPDDVRVRRVKAKEPDGSREFGWYRGVSFVPLGRGGFLFFAKARKNLAARRCTSEFDVRISRVRVQIRLYDTRPSAVPSRFRACEKAAREDPIAQTAIPCTYRSVLFGIFFCRVGRKST